MTATIEERVAKGAALMDEKVPGWANAVVLDGTDAELAGSIMDQFNWATQPETALLASMEQWAFMCMHPVETQTLANLWRPEIDRRLALKGATA